MKRGFCSGLLAGAFWAFTVYAVAAPVVQDIQYEAGEGTVTVKVVTSEPLPIETFKNDTAPANYIVLDFLGTVFTNLPSVFNVNENAVEKISLIRGEGDPGDLGEGFYSLDFLAFNLLSRADYALSQDGAVVTIKITSEHERHMREAGDESSDTVQLKPPIVVAKEIAQEKSQSSAEPRQEPASRRQDTRRSEEAKPEVSAPAAEEPSRGRRRLFGRRGRSDDEPEPEQAPPVVREPEKKTVASPAPVEAVSAREQKPVEGRTLIDRVVSETIREKEQANARIDTLTDELKQLQAMISQFKTEKGRLEDKLNELIAKADSLTDALDAEIRRRQLLGQRVDDLMAKRELYAKARDRYDQYGRQLEALSQRIESLSSDANNVRTKLDVVQGEKNKLEQTINSLSLEFGQLKSDYEVSVRQQEELNAKIDELSSQLKKIQEALERAKQEKNNAAAQAQSMESRYKFSDEELSRLRQLLTNRNTLIMELTREQDRLRRSLEEANTEKIKTESDFRTAREEFERLRREIEKILETR